MFRSSERKNIVILLLQDKSLGKVYQLGNGNESVQGQLSLGTSDKTTISCLCLLVKEEIGHVCWCMGMYIGANHLPQCLT